MSRIFLGLTLAIMICAGCAAKPEQGAANPANAPAPTPPATPGETPDETSSTPAMEMPKVSAAPEETKPTTPTPVPAATPEKVASGTTKADGSALTAYVGQDAVLAMSVKPAAFANNPTVKQIFEMADKLPGARASGNLKQFEEQTGISPNQIQQVVVAVTLEELMSLPTAMLTGLPPAIPVAVIELTTSEAASALFDSAPGEMDITVSGFAGKAVEYGVCIVKVADNRLVIGNQEQLEQIIGKTQPGGLANRLNSADGQSLTLAVDVESLAPAIQQLSQQGGPNPAAMIVLGITQQLKALDLSLSIDGSSLLSANIDTVSADSAQGLQQMLGGLLEQGNRQVQNALADTEQNDPKSLPLMKLASAAVQSLKVTTKDSQIQLTMPRPENLDQLPELLKPVYEEAAKAAAGASKKNNLKQIGLAFHNYHDVNNHFPAPDSDGGPEGSRQGSGLSWRVHLLPYLEEAALYNQFQLDEPWDSEHNSKLIEQVPAVFANSAADGKTSIHLFIGDEAPFKTKNSGPSIFHITDGTSNTILVVEAGEDTAEIWTKPGGLAVNGDAPFEPLGKIGDSFLVLMMDGSVRTISATLAAEVLYNLIRHADGNPVSP